MNCTCGAAARHTHEVDGETIHTCDGCHLVLQILKTNLWGDSVPEVLEILQRAPDGAEVRAKLCETPFVYTEAKTTPAPAQPAPTHSAPAVVESPAQGSDDLPVFFLPLPEDFHAVHREPPAAGG